MAGVSGVAGGLLMGAKNVVGWATGSGKKADQGADQKKKEDL